VIDERAALDRAKDLQWRNANGCVLTECELVQFRRFVKVATLAIVKFELKQDDAERFAAVEACGVER
jgi:hypothetical protein